MTTTTINGRAASLPDDPDALLIEVVRDQLKLTGTKLVCGGGVCGACTVLVDGAPVASCLMPAHAASGKSVTTVEGIGAAQLHPVQKAFMAHDALQCGFCTPGFIVEATAFCDRWRATRGTAVPTREEIGAALSGHLCRCGAYDGIFRAVADACAGRFDGDNIAAPRIEARDKVTGAAKYTVDINHDGQLEGLILRSREAHARIATLDLAPARALAGVTAVSLIGDDRIVRYVGEPIAAVAAKDRKTALAALAAIKLTSERLPAVIGLDAGRRDDAPVVFDRASRKRAGNVSEAAGGPAPWKQNIRGPTAVFSTRAKKARNWVDEARQASNKLLVEATFRTATQQHACLEPHAAVARFDGDRLTLHASTQQVFHLKEQIAKRYKLEHDKVRVIADHVGGGFGSKASLGVETIAAIELAREAKAPVRVVYDRHEELSVAGYRPAAELKVALLPSERGALKALSVTAHADTGAATNSTIAGLARLIYPAEAKDLSDFDVISNLPPGAAFRGPGGPPMAFAVEQSIDEAALRLKVDPIALRKRWDPDPNRQRLYDWASGLEVWRNRKPQQDGRYRRGIGMATGYWLYLWQPNVKVEVAVKGGRIVASTATQDIGTGTRSVLADTIAREFDLEPADIDVRIGDSALPEGPGSGGSRVTASVLPPTILAVRKLKAAMLEQATRKPAPGSNAPWRELIARSPDIAVTETRGEDSKNTAPGIRSPLREVGLLGMVFGWMMRRFSNIAVGAGVPSSVQVIEVEVDTWLGHVRVLNVHTGIAVGKIAAPALARSQACGAVIQGLGYALYEARELDPTNGDVLTAGMEDYRIPGIADTPEIDVHFDEAGFDHVLGNSVGIGEASTVPTSAAVANAIHDAIGIRLTEIPIRPDRIVAALKGRTAA
ncbi:MULTISPECIES: molybdopterin-dependent oxidoreductase [Bradyrhizobium]|jgi:xanthine dehydrogenase YagR molybdenum-binding subunit|uniref:molybdopterin-dependent oxidoreductase n=1 Tax=Bradyrhizobium TaxID=374 RepID=UPI0004204452|nr:MULTISPECIES: molybdopterin-dependent oxidoreductase [Bradyrhizobium]KIU51821.1 dehydrogenase [Bradyrhizobium elkanii]MBK5651493.1 molybdopterin-dependent oxidoreductase [Rhizobium sp.]OCX28439.1 dehydrogenase [Bradyrhizobium sp. UASWS1016]